MMPKFLGEPWYPGGFPLRPDQIHINNETVQQIILRRWEGNASIDDEEVLKEYVLYYIGSPLVDIQCDDEEQEQKFNSLPLDDLLDVLLDSGIDPL